ncbi:DHS-like NAD/FAD-binding domain-containing protein [Durotheca rogersii]|uniref:DHS-like NAD/FAD-binding domain-containing protein n=1 Tax=Durotheca rogersii TaxID=419775 RepID=UPI002220AE5B|nr:DHS-like NAD/FAD-binding domain-containing protein [Durotheca rogersii]KAI5861522.1 DHS-like NAD/FAD-binding domain-containing protein [Durotheca rogersii]
MPTLQVKPASSELLQHVADSLGKAKKVVIITGAGISTNSGIPDFRSENGLYSLIQAQFERAEAGCHKETEGQAVGFAISGRPVKRRRISYASEKSSTGQEPTSKATPSSTGSATRGRTSAPVDHANADVQKPTPHAIDDSSVRRDAVTPSEAALQRLARSQPGLRPPLPRHIIQAFAPTCAQSSTSDEASLLASQSSQSSSASPRTEDSCPSTASGSQGIPTGATTPSALPAETFSSSPLSSPPPILFDPFEITNSSIDGSFQESTGSSDMSDFEETQTSFLASQTSNPSIRNMKGRDLFDSNIWADPLKTSVFYRFATTLRQKVKDVKPTKTHHFIAHIRDSGKLARVYTQNIDEIEKKIGLRTDLRSGAGNRRRKSAKQQLISLEKDSKENSEVITGVEDPANVDPIQPSQGSDVSGRIHTRPAATQDKGVECVFLHGSLHALRCFVCGKLCDWDEADRESCTMLGEQPECPHCAGATAARQEKGKRALGVGKLRPDIVLYGEEHPQSDLISPIVQHDLSAGPDLLLILGTSLKVHGLKVMVKEFSKAVHKKGGKVVFINLTKPSESVWGEIIDYWIEWDCDAWVDDLRDRKPQLWLSSSEVIELERQKREALAEKKKESMSKRRESAIEKKRDSLEEKRQRKTEADKSRPPPKHPAAMRNDYQCGAYVVWEIFQTLAKIGDRPFDNLGYTPPRRSPPGDPPPSEALKRDPPVKKKKRARKSAPAALAVLAEFEMRPTSVVTTKPVAKYNSRSQYAKAAQELARTGKSPTPVRLAELNGLATPNGKSQMSPYNPPSSITAAVKVNPRQRKRKTIDGIPVGSVASLVGRPKLPLPVPLNVPREALPRSEFAFATPSPLPPQGPILAPLHPGWERSPPAKITPLEPSLDISPPSPLADLPPVPRSQVFALRQSTHPMIFSDPLVKLHYETTNYRKPPQEASAATDDKTPSPSDQLRRELARRKELEEAEAPGGLKGS